MSTVKPSLSELRQNLASSLYPRKSVKFSDSDVGSLADWHQQRAIQLNKEASELIHQSKDGRSSRHTRAEKMFAARISAEMANKHQETAALLRKFNYNLG